VEVEDLKPTEKWQSVPLAEETQQFTPMSTVSAGGSYLDTKASFHEYTLQAAYPGKEDVRVQKELVREKGKDGLEPGMKSGCFPLHRQYNM
jgi:hypothetical protein